jgi:DnaD/phage-associated family protein
VKGFGGFPAGKTKATRIPNLFFSELLPAIDHLAELKVTLYCFWRLHRMQGEVRFVRRDEIEADRPLMAGLAAHAEAAIEVLSDALERATARGTLLHVALDGPDGEDDLYFMNTPKGRAAVEGIESGQWRPHTDDTHVPFDLTVERPNIYTLYEQNIGPLTPLIADKLRDIEDGYSEVWVRQAIDIAVQHNKRSLAYVTAILDRWQTEGKRREEYRGDTARDRRRYIEGEFADYIEY